MALSLIKRSPLTEATPTVIPPNAQRASTAGRVGYVPNIPLGGSTDTNPGSTGQLNRNDQMEQLMAAYIMCPWVSACVDVIAKTCTAGGIQCVPNATDLEDNTIPTPPPAVKEVQNLLQFINPYDDVRQLFRSVIADLLIFGDSFTEIVYFMDKPIALYRLDPATMIVRADEHGVIKGYTQDMPTGRQALFDPQDVIHVRFDSPDGGLYGVSPTAKNLLPIEAWLFTMALVKETMKKGDPWRIHIDWSIALPEAERRRFSQQYAIKNLGAKNIGNPFETKGGTTVQELGTNQLTNWLNTLQQRRDEIISGYGVPPSKVSVIEAGNIGGGQGTSQDKSFRVNTCGPLEELVLEKFTSSLMFLAYGITDWHLAFGEVDWRDDEVIEVIRDMRLRNGGWTLNRLRSDINEPPIPGGDDAVLVDRQNMVLWSDMKPLSNANVAAIQMASKDVNGGATSQSPGSPGKPGGGSGSGPNTASAGEDELYEKPFSLRTAVEDRFGHTQARNELYQAFQRDFADRRKRTLKELPPHAS